MGKKELISNEKYHRKILATRKKSLIKKLSELSTLCDVGVGMIIYEDNHGGPKIWPQNPENINELINKYKKQSEKDSKRRSANLSIALKKWQEKVEKDIRELQRIDVDVDVDEPTPPAWDGIISSLDDLSEEQVVEIGKLIEKKIEIVKKSIDDKNHILQLALPSTSNSTKKAQPIEQSHDTTQAQPIQFHNPMQVQPTPNHHPRTSLNNTKKEQTTLSHNTTQASQPIEFHNFMQVQPTENHRPPHAQYLHMRNTNTQLGVCYRRPTHFVHPQVFYVPAQCVYGQSHQGVPSLDHANRMAAHAMTMVPVNYGHYTQHAAAAPSSSNALYNPRDASVHYRPALAQYAMWYPCPQQPTRP